MKISSMFAILGICCFVLLGYYHEQAHVQVYNIYGIDAHAEYLKHFPSFVTIADDPCQTDSCKLAQSNVESIGYNCLPLFVLLFFGLLILIGLMEIKIRCHT